MATKDERLEQFERELRSRYPAINKDTLDIVMAALSRGYDEGFADGVVRGQNYQAQITDMITGALRPASPDTAETQEFVREGSL